MAKLKYKTQAVNTAIDPAGGFFCRVVNADPVEDDAVFQEVIDSLRLTESVFGLKKAVEAVIDTAMRKTSQDGVPRKVGGLFRTFITIKGKVPNGDSPFTALAGHGSGAYVRWGLSSEVTREVDYNSVSISNVQGAQSVAVSSIAYNGAEENAFDIRTGTPILVTGRNLAFIDGDSVTVSRMADGAEVILATLVPDESDYYHESFAWPSGLDGLEAGAEVKFTFRLRGGDPEATPVVVSKPVTVNAGATPPAPTGPTLTGVHAPGIESPMIRVESGVWFDGTGLDGWTEGRDSIWCKNNRAEEAEFVRMDGDGSGAAVEFDGGMLKADEGAWSVLTDLGIVEGSEVRFKVTINGQSAEIVAMVAET